LAKLNLPNISDGNLKEKKSESMGLKNNENKSNLPSKPQLINEQKINTDIKQKSEEIKKPQEKKQGDTPATDQVAGPKNENKFLKSLPKIEEKVFDKKYMDENIKNNGNHYKNIREKNHRS
jgi:hypothetical protein